MGRGEAGCRGRTENRASFLLFFFRGALSAAPRLPTSAHRARPGPARAPARPVELDRVPQQPLEGGQGPQAVRLGLAPPRSGRPPARARPASVPPPDAHRPPLFLFFFFPLPRLGPARTPHPPDRVVSRVARRRWWCGGGEGTARLPPFRQHSPVFFVLSLPSAAPSPAPAARNRPHASFSRPRPADGHCSPLAQR